MMKRGHAEVADELLVLLAQDGSAKAMNALAKRWNRKLLAHALNILKNADEAADAVQDAWLAIVKSMRSLHDPALFKPWAYRIVTHKCADLLRRKLRERKNVTSSTEFHEPAAATNDLDSDEANAESVIALRSAIDALPIEHRTLLSMFYSAGMNVQQIAAALRIPAGTVKSRLHHLRKVLGSAVEKTTTGKEVS